MLMRWLSLLLLVVSATGCEFLNADGLVSARVDDIEVHIAIASDIESRRQGLMGRASMGPDQGMLLAYPRQLIIRLWMLDTHLPLDVGFFDRDGILVGITSMEPDGGRKVHQAPQPCMYALEMNRGWFARNNIQLGARLSLPQEAPAE